MRQAFILVLMCASAVALCTRMLLVYGRLLLASRRWASGPRGCETGASIRRCIGTGSAADTSTGTLAYRGLLLASCRQASGLRGCGAGASTFRCIGNDSAAGTGTGTGGPGGACL